VSCLRASVEKGSGEEAEGAAAAMTKLQRPPAIVPFARAMADNEAASPTVRARMREVSCLGDDRRHQHRPWPALAPSRYRPTLPLNPVQRLDPAANGAPPASRRP
jgi:hypothetical protein